MLKQRIITAFILIPLVLGLLFYGNSWLLLTTITIILAACGWEWTKLMPQDKKIVKVAYILTLLILFAGSFAYFGYWLFIGLVGWLICLIAIVTYPASQAIWANAVLVALAGWILLPVCMQSLVKIYQLPQGKSLVLFLLLLVWAADVGAYFTGKAVGRHKLIPHVSPGKSWEGLFGGVILSLIVSWAAVYYFPIDAVMQWIILALIVTLISIEGDLLISMLKRRCQLKDSGHLLPGHGGMLDRLDSLIAALPWFYAGIHYFRLMS